MANQNRDIQMVQGKKCGVEYVRRETMPTKKSKETETSP